jgi:SAM-dependent methyltransferase
MSYSDKIGNYQGDCKVLLGKYPKFSDYIKYFSRYQLGNGLDLGCGPDACNGKFFRFCTLDGCDADEDVVGSIPDTYDCTFVFKLGQDKLPYDSNRIDFVILSCVIQHLNNYDDLVTGLVDVARIIKPGGQIFLMFKAGANNTVLTHYNEYYKETRNFRVFDPADVQTLAQLIKLRVVSSELLMDENWIPYCCMVLEK